LIIPSQLPWGNQTAAECILAHIASGYGKVCVGLFSLFGGAQSAGGAPPQGPTQLTQPSPVKSRRPAGGVAFLSLVTLFPAFSTGRTYDALGPPLYPCSKCGQMHWSWQGCLPQPAGAFAVPAPPTVVPSYPSSNSGEQGPRYGWHHLNCPRNFRCRSSVEVGCSMR
jgi:hypothetical protein